MTFSFRKTDYEEIAHLQTSFDKSDLKEVYESLYGELNLINKYEYSYLTVTIFDSLQNPIGFICFNDYPQQLAPSSDNIHFNNWEDWIAESYSINVKVKPMNSLWVSFFYVKEEKYEQSIISELLQYIFENIQRVEFILYFLPNENDENEKLVKYKLGGYFEEIKSLDFIRENALNQGIKRNSRIFITNKIKVCTQLIIRMAHEEDHDDLAELFNTQTEILTNIYGEFFLADLIATFNQTRNITKALKSPGKVLVAESHAKAYGIMSLSTEIDLKLLNDNFDLSTYNYLLDPEYPQILDFLRSKKVAEQKLADVRERQKQKKLVYQETKQCSWIGQRIMLQDFCKKIEVNFKVEMENIVNNEHLYRVLDKKGLEKIIDNSLDLFDYFYPNMKIVEQQKGNADLFSIIMNKREFFLQTLQYFGLPANYIEGVGHWANWEQKILEERKQAQLKRPLKKGKKDLNRKKKEEQKEEFKPPDHFDLEPLQLAFSKFCLFDCELRCEIYDLLHSRKKEIKELFLQETGELNEDKIFDTNKIVESFLSKKIELSVDIQSDVITSGLKCFSHIIFEEFNEEIVAVDKNQEKEKLKQKSEVLKRFQELNDAPKLIKVTRSFCSYKDLYDSFQQIQDYGILLCSLEKIKSNLLEKYVENMKIQEQKNKSYEEQQFQKVYKDKEESLNQHYLNDIKQLENIDEFPDYIPFLAQKAVVINLFCMDYMFDSRSFEFLQYSFELFPQMEYIVLTQPHSVQVGNILQQFSLAPKKINSNFNHVLYVLHRDSLKINFLKLIQSQIVELPAFLEFSNDKEEEEQIECLTKEAIRNIESGLKSFSIYCYDNIVGQIVISNKINLEFYFSHFCLEDHLISQDSLLQNCAKIEFMNINPIFEKATKPILKEVLRLSNKACLFLETSFKSVIPFFFKEMNIVKAKRNPRLQTQKFEIQFFENVSKSFDQDSAVFALSLIKKRDLSMEKTHINNRVVIVGASDTGISVLETILSVPNLIFNYCFLLAPGGLPINYSGNQKNSLIPLSTSFNQNEIDALLLDSRVNILEAKMMQMNNEEKNIELDKKFSLYYDQMIFSVGLIETELQNRNLISYGYKLFSPYQYDSNCLINGVYSMNDPYLERVFDENQQIEKSSFPIYLLKKTRKPENIVVYGRNLPVFTFITGLLNKGVKGWNIILVIPEKSFQGKRQFQNFQERKIYEDKIISDQDAFESDYINDLVIQSFYKSGVRIYKDYQLDSIKKQNNVLQKITLKRLNEDLEEEIIEINTRLLVTSNILDIDKQFFQVIHSKGLVYNGRLIIHNDFSTTEQDLFATGKICEFSQRYKQESFGTNLRTDKYDGRELGFKTGLHFLHYLNLSDFLDVKAFLTLEDKIPKFFCPLGHIAFLHQNYWYYHISIKNWVTQRIDFNQTKNRDPIFTNTIGQKENGCYFKINFDNNGLIDEIIYLGKQPLMISSLKSFIGCSETCLNKLKVKLEKNLYNDALEYLSQKWTSAMFHEYFLEFKHQVKIQLSQNEQILDDLSQLEKENKLYELNEIELQNKLKGMDSSIQDYLTKVLKDFIINNNKDLPFYYSKKNTLVKQIK